MLSSAVDAADRDDLVVEAPGVLRRGRALLRAVRPGVLVLARDAELAADQRRLLDHVQPVERRLRARRRPCGRAPRRGRCGSRSAPLGSRYGAFDIDSIPPVTTTSCSPARIIRSAISIARIDDAQTLLIVSAGTSFGIPAPIAACRAGAWPAPAWSTWPMIT